MTPPRIIHEEQTAFITCRAVNRSFRFVPNEQVTQTIRFVFAYTCSKFNVSLHEVLYMSDHFHLLLTAHTKCIPDFMEELNSLMARALNALRGISGTNFEKGYNLVEPQDAEKTLEHAIYTLVNPCASDLVTKARHWKGFTTIGMEYGQEILVPKPRFGMWEPKPAKKPKKKPRKRRDARTPSKCGRSTIPDVVALRLVRPPVRGELSDGELREFVLKRVEEEENECEAVRAAKRKKVFGMRNVMRQHWASMPGTEDLFGVRPTVSAKHKTKRVEALRNKGVFEEAYAIARARWLAGETDVEFPAGTWLMWRRYAANCADSS
ncbi:transposase [Enhygromyxa salina]|uniref:Transposase IS200 like protein n=1 Tax=Enhygromyxa salina TaxID=215803 RepID=A0A2S9YJF2_9BACT|nr:transposase [Enhygromyxa salina]PRQ05172.1 Transposase IS200 like protein [Enhygromyxa salina]